MASRQAPFQGRCRPRRQQPDRTPLARLERRTPEPEQVTFVCELAGSQSFAGPNVLDVLLGCPRRHVRCHGHDVLHGRVLLLSRVRSSQTTPGAPRMFHGLAPPTARRAADSTHQRRCDARHHLAWVSASPPDGRRTTPLPTAGTVRSEGSATERGHRTTARGRRRRARSAPRHETQPSTRGDVGGSSRRVLYARCSRRRRRSGLSSVPWTSSPRLSPEWMIRPASRSAAPAMI